ncbi:hypothetical protein Bca4012_070829 [Brassica carinata]
MGGFWVISNEHGLTWGSLVVHGSSSHESESLDLTPAKRVRALNVDLLENFDQNSVTRSVISFKVKEEKLDKSR